MRKKSIARRAASLPRFITASLSAIVLSTAARSDDFETGVAAYGKGNLAEAYRAWTAASAKGHAPAQYNVGLMHLKGLGIATDYTRAFQSFMGASKAGDPLASLQMARMFESGLGVPKDVQMAMIFITAGIAALPDGPCRDLAETRRKTLMRFVSAAEVEQAVSEAKQIVKLPAETAPQRRIDGNCLESVVLTTSDKPSLTTALAQAKKAEPVAPKREEAILKASGGGSSLPTDGSAKAAQQAGHAYFVQVASYLRMEDALRQQSAVESRHRDIMTDNRIMVVQATTPTLGEVFRVRIGPFGDRDAALRTCDALRARKESCLVLKSPTPDTPLPVANAGAR